MGNATKNIWSNFNFSKNQLLKARIENLTTLQIAALANTLTNNDKGLIVYDTVASILNIWNGTAFIDINSSIPTLQEISEQGADSTIKLSFNGVDYATINDIPSTPSLQQVSNIGFNSTVRLQFNGTNYATVNDIPSTVNNILQNGNSFGAAVRIGSNDTQPFIFETNNIARARFLETGAFIINDIINNFNSIAEVRNITSSNTLSLVTTYTPTVTKSFYSIIAVNQSSSGYKNSFIESRIGTGTSLDFTNTESKILQTGTVSMTGTGFVNKNLFHSTEGGTLNTSNLNLNENQFRVDQFGTVTADNIILNNNKLILTQTTPGTISSFTFNNVESIYGSNNINITNAYGYKVDSSFDNIVGTNKYPFFSASNATSQHKGDFEFLGAVKLKGVSNFVTIRASSSTNPYTLTLPITQGVADSFLINDGVGNLTFIPIYTTPPITPTSTGIKGQKAYDGTHFYECIATNSWIKIATVSFL